MFESKKLSAVVFVIFCFFGQLHAKQAPTLDFKFEDAPDDSWEAWLHKIHIRSQKDPAPERPDKKNYLYPLPTWVDCHLSWLYEKKNKLHLKIELPESIVLESNSDKCTGQAELWAAKNLSN